MKNTVLAFILSSGFIALGQVASNGKSNLCSSDLGKNDSYIIYPGCEKEKNNAKLKKCANKKIQDYFQRNLFIKPHVKKSLKSRNQKLNILFKIDTTGKVFSAKARARNLVLEKEALRLVKRLPTFTPARVDGKACIMPYILPIEIIIPKE